MLLARFHILFIEEKLEKMISNNINVLLVEDQEINQFIIAEILRNYNINLDIADNGLIATEMVNNTLYELILMDMEMPIMDGRAATKIIRKYFPINKLPILAMTGDSIIGMQRKISQFGMNDFILKPFKSEELIEIINKWLCGKIIKNNITHIPKKYPVIKYLDCEDGILRLNNNIEAYVKIILKFKNSNYNIYNNLHNLFISKDYDNCEQLIHKLKGISGNIGAIKLYKSCTNLLIDLENKNYDHFQVLEIEFKEIITELLNEIIKFEMTIEKKEVENIELDSYNVHDDIERLKKLLLSNNIESLSVIENIILKNKNREIENLLLESLKLIENYEFEKSLKILENLYL